MSFCFKKTVVVLVGIPPAAAVAGIYSTVLLEFLVSTVICPQPSTVPIYTQFSSGFSH